jgi:tetratricopeptide (TPR) repeat protein
MGRSFSPISSIAALERYDVRANNPFEKLGFVFQVNERRGKVYHQQIRKDSSGTAIASHEDEVHYVLGSGTRGRTYLTNRDGYLFESPISWFSQKQCWDLSPGFVQVSLSGRPIRDDCLVCHCNKAQGVKDTENRYNSPIFDGYAIGCERCHGPGELHVQRRQRGEVEKEFDETIVNPGRLGPPLREAVCYQCHLLGVDRVQRRNRQTFDFRPGLPLHLFRSVFVWAPGSAPKENDVGHVEQMQFSRCFQSSKGELGCISCHDPHGGPSSDEKAAFYRGRCLKCHQETSCALPLTTRRNQSKNDSCSECHMPRLSIGLIAHTSSTDHRILRKPLGKSDVRNRKPKTGDDRDSDIRFGLDDRATRLSREFLPDQDVAWSRNRLAHANPSNSRKLLLVNFYQDLLDPQDEGAERDLGLALAKLRGVDRNAKTTAAAAALPILEKAVQHDPYDVVAWEGKAIALWQLDRERDALAAIEKALELSPQREGTLQFAANFAQRLRLDEAAINYWRRAINVNPWLPQYHSHLARLLANNQEWSAAVEECLATLRLEPANSDIRFLLAQCYIQTGRNDQAVSELEIAIKLRPEKETEMLREIPRTKFQMPRVR